MAIQLIKEQLTQWAKQILPHSFRKQLRIARLGLRYAFLFSKPKESYYCPVLNKRLKGFIKKGKQLITHKNEALSRHRMLLHYLNENKILNMSPIKLLHIAPEECLSEVFSKQENINYVGLDKFCNGYSYNNFVQEGDITDLPFGENSFDLIICNHVLEHIPDDYQAMNELNRVLKSSGICFITVPINKQLMATDEDKNITSPIERKKRFGQWDHVRYYALDITDRLLKSGFKTVEALDYKNRIGKDMADYYGIQNDVLIVCRN